jgi:hypothetical protein
MRHQINQLRVKEISKLFRDLIPVRIGILTVLFINNWNEIRKDKRYLSQIFSSIENEMEKSLTDIKQVIPKQLATFHVLDYDVNNDKVILCEIIK